MKTIVISGNYNQGLNWAESDCKKRWNNGNTSCSLSDYIIISSVNQIRGLRDPHGVFVGTWREREDIKEIVETLYSQSDRVNEDLERILNDLRKITPTITYTKKTDTWNIHDTNPLSLEGRCVGIFKLPEDFDWRKMNDKQTIDKTLFEQK